MAKPNWWTEYFDAQYLLEYEPLFSPERDRKEAARLIDVLGLPSGSRILDVPCGQGRHAHLLAEVGFDVDGLDYSTELLARARQRGTSSRLRYTRGDMRRLPARWTGRFDAVLNLFTSFGMVAVVTASWRVFFNATGGRRPTALSSHTSGASTGCRVSSQCTPFGRELQAGDRASIGFGFTPPRDSPSYAPTLG